MNDLWRISQIRLLFHFVWASLVGHMNPAPARENIAACACLCMLVHA